MARQAETTSPAPPSHRGVRTKRIILLCCEELRFVACGLEDALAERGWSVRVEYGRDARPWVQQRPIERPSMRVLCVPGTVDRALAKQIRTALGPDPDADLHVIGVDDSPGLVQEIERLAGVRTPKRRSIHATPRLAHQTLVEQQVPRRRSPIAALGAAAALLLMLGGGLTLDRHSSGLRSVATMPSASLLHALGSAEQAPAEPPVLTAVAPFDYDSWEPLPSELAPEEELIIIDDDEDEATSLVPALTPPTMAPPVLDGIASPLGSDTIAPLDPSLDDGTNKLTLPYGYLPIGNVDISAAELPTGFLPVAGLQVQAPLAELPPGFLPVAGLPVAHSAALASNALLPGTIADQAQPPIDLPPGFMPVAGLPVTPGADPVNVSDLPKAVTYDPFVPRYVNGAASVTKTADPFIDG